MPFGINVKAQTNKIIILILYAVITMRMSASIIGRLKDFTSYIECFFYSYETIENGDTLHFKGNKT